MNTQLTTLPAVFSVAMTRPRILIIEDERALTDVLTWVCIFYLGDFHAASRRG